MLKTVPIREVTIKAGKAAEIFNFDEYAPNTVRSIILEFNKKTIEGTLTIDGIDVNFNLTNLVNWELQQAFSGFWLGAIDDCTPLYALVFTELFPEFSCGTPPPESRQLPVPLLFR